MSQQEFEMGPQTNQQNSSNEEDEVYKPQYPYSWSGKINKEGVPRDEPPSNYDATVMQQGYQAQTPNTSNAPAQQAQVNNQHQYIPPAGDGDAYEQGYRPYRYQRTQGVPPWARPQQHQRNPARFAFTIFVLIIVAVLMAIFGALGPVIVDVIGGLLILLFIIFVPLLLILLFVFFVVFFRRSRRRRIRYWYRRRGSWW
jgi:hypothetical protein